MQPLQRTAWRFLKKRKIELPHDLPTPILGVCLKQTKMPFPQSVACQCLRAPMGSDPQSTAGRHRRAPLQAQPALSALSTGVEVPRPHSQGRKFSCTCYVPFHKVSQGTELITQCDGLIMSLAWHQPPWLPRFSSSLCPEHCPMNSGFK